MEDIDFPLTRTEAFRLLISTSGKVKMLLALGLGTGISIDDAHDLLSSQLESSFEIHGRKVIVPNFIRKELKPYFQKKNGIIFDSGTEYMQKVVLKRTQEVLGKVRSYKALRRTFVRMCAEAGVPMELVIENTGENAGIIYPIYRPFSLANQKSILEL